mgnify:CR=1
RHVCDLLVRLQTLLDRERGEVTPTLRLPLAHRFDRGGALISVDSLLFELGVVRFEKVKQCLAILRTLSIVSSRLVALRMMRAWSSARSAPRGSGTRSAG